MSASGGMGGAEVSVGRSAGSSQGTLEDAGPCSSRPWAWASRTDGSPYDALRAAGCGGLHALAVATLQLLGNPRVCGWKFSPGNRVGRLNCCLLLHYGGVIFRPSPRGTLLPPGEISRKVVGLTPVGDLVFITPSAGRRAPQTCAASFASCVVWRYLGGTRVLGHCEERKRCVGGGAPT